MPRAGRFATYHSDYWCCFECGLYTLTVEFGVSERIGLYEHKDLSAPNFVFREEVEGPQFNRMRWAIAEIRKVYTDPDFYSVAKHGGPQALAGWLEDQDCPVQSAAVLNWDDLSWLCALVPMRLL